MDTPLIWAKRWGEWQEVLSKYSKAQAPQAVRDVENKLEEYGI